MNRRDSRPSEQRFYRIAVGGANIALCAMLAYGITRYFDLVVPRVGHRFAFIPILMAAVAVWTGIRGAIVLLRRGGGGS
jgi:hypothetical protein